MTNPRRRRLAGVASTHCVGWHSSNPSPCWPRRGTAVWRPRIRFCRHRAGNHRTHPSTRKHDITQEGFVSVCSVCSVVKKNGIATQTQDHLPNWVFLLHQLEESQSLAGEVGFWTVLTRREKIDLILGGQIEPWTAPPVPAPRTSATAQAIPTP